MKLKTHLKTHLKPLILLAGFWFAQRHVHGQMAKAGSDWQHVRALPSETTIDVRSTTIHVHCRVTAVTEESLACSRGGTPFNFQRSEVRSIKISHRGRSALIGSAIGAGAFGIAGFAATTGGGDSFFGSNFLRGQVTGVALGVGAVLGGGIGALTDFSKSTVYQVF